MKRTSSTITVTDAAWTGRGDFLAIGDGDEAEMVVVRAVRGTTVEVGRLRWWHKAARRSAARLWMWRHIGADVADTARVRLCGLRGHRLTREGPVRGYRNRLRYCWCSEKRQRVPQWPIVREDGAEIGGATLLAEHGYDPDLPARGVTGPPGEVIDGRGHEGGRLVRVKLRNHVCALEGVIIDGHSDPDRNGSCVHCGKDGG